MNDIIINNFAFYPASVGGPVRTSSCEMKCCFIHAIWHCLQEVHFVWCTKRDQFETENIAGANMKRPPK